VLRHRAERDGEAVGDLASRPLAIPHQSEDLAPGRVADHLQAIH
jgi:hypothetical protein